MPSTPPGPDFERAPDQRIIPGDYEDPKRPVIPRTTVPLLNRLRAALKPSVKRSAGPGFRKPKTWAPWVIRDPEVRKPARGRRPSDYTVQRSDEDDDLS